MPTVTLPMTRAMKRALRAHTPSSKAPLVVAAAGAALGLALYAQDYVMTAVVVFGVWCGLAPILIMSYRLSLPRDLREGTFARTTGTLVIDATVLRIDGRTLTLTDAPEAIAAGGVTMAIVDHTEHGGFVFAVRDGAGRVLYRARGYEPEPLPENTP